MGKPPGLLPLDGLQTYSLRRRKSLVHIRNFAQPVPRGSSFRKWMESLPDFLAVKNMREVTRRIARAHRRGKVVILGMGAHPIKVGLSPLIIHLMREGLIQAVAMNGAGIIHDFEIAYAGQTSEDVAAEVGQGNFGMAEETGTFLNQAIRDGGARGWGIGRSAGEMILKERLPHRDLSITAAGRRLGIPVTVHVAIGTDIIHMHPKADGAAIGQGSLLDFRLFASMVARLEGGVYINLGSAVILPEVFLKALTLVRNLEHRVRRFTTVNMDFITHYRPLTNVVDRPTRDGGKGFHFIGHHEIMFPLLYGALLEEIKK